MRFVLDASVTLSWLLRDTAARDEGYPFAVLNALRDANTAAIVPMTWGLEIANVIARSEAKELVTAAQSGSFIALLEGIPIDVDAETFTHVLSDTLQLSLPLSTVFIRCILSGTRPAQRRPDGDPR